MQRQREAYNHLQLFRQAENEKEREWREGEIDRYTQRDRVWLCMAVLPRAAAAATALPQTLELGLIKELVEHENLSRTERKE